ncbi:MAG: hypothetical protein P1V34_09455 [Alphaproteobacteria bacterium]|nr:hypothetical protein [Alphaproteobacteria bacterium]
MRNRMPILVMGAAEDGLIPPPFVRSTARLLGETAHILPHTGHGIMLDSAWQTAADTLAQWLSEYDM